MNPLITVQGIQKAVCPAFFSRLRLYEPRLIVEYGGAASGKSFFIAQKLILKALASKRRVLVVRKVAATLRDSVHSLLLSILDPLLIRSSSKSDLSITLLNGSVFLLKGLDDPEKIKSITGIDDIWIEEATELSKEDFIQLSLRLRSQKPFPQIHLSFNPVSKQNWVYSTFFSGKRPDCALFHSTFADNPFLPDNFLQELLLLKDSHPAYYRIYALGEFATLDTLVFPKVSYRLIRPQEVAALPLSVGLDFGYAVDPSAIVSVRFDLAARTVFIVDAYQRTGLSNTQLADAIFGLGLAKERIIADSAEPKSIDELRRAGLRVTAAVKGPDSVRHGLQWLASCELVADERLDVLRLEFENYTWQKNQDGQPINRPIDSFNHCIDALRYACEPFMRAHPGCIRF